LYAWEVLLSWGSGCIAKETNLLKGAVLSTFTKVLIILLTIFSIFLCGIVVTYVANAENYKKLYNNRNNQVQSAQREKDNANDQYTKLKEETDRQMEALTTKTGELQRTLDDLKGQLTQAGLDYSEAQDKINAWVSVVDDFKKTNEGYLELLNNTLYQLHEVQADLTKEISRHKETTNALHVKMAVLTDVQKLYKQLLEEKADLQNKLNVLLRQYGQVITTTPPITRPKEEILPMPPVQSPVVKDIGLKGLITVVDLKYSLAEISIGKADGVKEKMKFYVTRGDDFICEILIFDVDAERAVGYLQLVKLQPKIGDNVTTNL